eukprot:714453-Pelagomonas_calceolata.AAC.1
MRIDQMRLCILPSAHSANTLQVTYGKHEGLHNLCILWCDLWQARRLARPIKAQTFFVWLMASINREAEA